ERARDAGRGARTAAQGQRGDTSAMNPSSQPPRPQAPGQPGKPTPPTMPPRKYWLFFVAVLLVNYLVTHFFFPAADAPITVPYTVFRAEAGKGNVSAIYSQGTGIEGRFKSPVTWPAPEPAQQGGQAQQPPAPRTG